MILENTRLEETKKNKEIKPFKVYREMDDEQKQRISQNPSLHSPKSEETKHKISQTMKARWAATPHRPQTSNIFDIMLQEQPIRLTEKDVRHIVQECIMKALQMISDCA